MIRVYLASVRDFGKTHRQNQSLTADAVLFEVCGEIPQREENGRPVLKHGFVSISHSGDTVAVALSPEPVGIDIEEKKPRPTALWARAGAENGYSDWCKKEAYVKFLGEGFVTHPAQVRIPSDVWTVSAETETLCLALCAKTKTGFTVKQEVAPHVWETALLHR